MTLKRAIRIASAWSQGHVCTLRDGEAEEYHKMALEAFLAMQDSEPFYCKYESCEFNSGFIGCRLSYGWECPHGVKRWHSVKKTKEET